MISGVGTSTGLLKRDAEKDAPSRVVVLGAVRSGAQALCHEARSRSCSTEETSHTQSWPSRRTIVMQESFSSRTSTAIEILTGIVKQKRTIASPIHYGNKSCSKFHDYALQVASLCSLLFSCRTLRNSLSTLVTSLNASPSWGQTHESDRPDPIVVEDISGKIKPCPTRSLTGTSNLHAGEPEHGGRIMNSTDGRWSYDTTKRLAADEAGHRNPGKSEIESSPCKALRTLAKTGYDSGSLMWRCWL